MEKLKALFTNSPIEWAKMSKIYPEILEKNHIKICMPTDIHKNHVKTVYAGSIFTLAEMSAGALFFAMYGMDDFAPVVSQAEISYTKPILTSTMYVEESMSQEEADALIAPVREKGKGGIFLETIVRNDEGEECAKLKVRIYCMPLKSVNNK